MPPFVIDPDAGTITCTTCGKTSHHPEDVRQRFCGHCNKFHAEPDCDWCHEPIRPGEKISHIQMNGRNVHQECAFRAVMGGANHIRKLCTCCGGTAQPDDEGLSRREAARAAFKAWHESHRSTF